MKILLIGNGGREHALAWKLSLSPKVSRVYVAPGNVGTQLEAKVQNVNITDIDKLIEFAQSEQISYTVVGPEAPLANGIVDKFRLAGLLIWGPNQYCAQLESSKAFAKEFMQEFAIPTAGYAKFSDLAQACEYIKRQGAPIVIKADGLAAGKGVLVAQTIEEAIAFTQEVLLDNKFGNAGSCVVVEEFLDGTEASFIAMIDGNNILAMATSQDHKRLLDHDMGPNTGGMGAYSPAPVVTPKIHQFVMTQVMQKVIEGMRARGQTYTGFLYAGLMISKSGEVKILEFNCRFGDPETQPIMCRLDSDLAQMIEVGLAGQLNTISPIWSSDAAVGVVLASHGYPENPQLGDEIQLSKALNNTPNTKLFYAGVKIDGTQLITNGGRVFCLVAKASSLEQARTNAYATINSVQFDGMQYRTDIASKINLK